MSLMNWLRRKGLNWQIRWNLWKLKRAEKRREKFLLLTEEQYQRILNEKKK